MSNKDKYRLLCNTEKNIPIFSHDWWLDTVCGEKKWDVLLIEQKGRIQATLPLYVPHSDIVSMPSYTQTMGPWFAASSSDTKYTTELGPVSYTHLDVYKRQILYRSEIGIFMT